MTDYEEERNLGISENYAYYLSVYYLSVLLCNSKRYECKYLEHVYAFLTPFDGIYNSLRNLFAYYKIINLLFVYSVYSLIHSAIQFPN